MTVRIIEGDCLAVLAEFEAERVDACVTDPPYDLLQVSRNGSRRVNPPDNPYGRHGERGGGFMGMAWDATGIAAHREGFGFIGIEREAEYVEIARRRITGDAPLLVEIV